MSTTSLSATSLSVSGDITAGGTVSSVQPCMRCNNTYNGGRTFAAQASILYTNAALTFDIGKGSYGWDSTKGVYFFPKTGYYRVTVYARATSGGDTNTGLTLLNYISSGNYTNIIPDGTGADGVAWCCLDGSSRLLATYSDLVYGTAGQGVFPSVYDSTSIAWVSFSVHLVSV